MEHEHEHESGPKEVTPEQKLANAVEVTFREFMSFPDEYAYTASVLWVMHTHLRTVTGEFLPYITPRLYFGSNKAGCGKSLATELATRMSYNGRLIAEPTPPSVTTMLNVDMATPGLDEIDLLFGTGRGKGQMRTILNSGYKKGALVTRQRSDEVDWQNCHGPVAMNGKNANRFLNHPNFETLRSRSISIVLERKKPGAYVNRWDPEVHEGRLHGLMGRLKQWGLANGRDIVKINVEAIIPPEIDNRDREIWKVLFQVSEHLGGDWPQRCELAAKAHVLGDHQLITDHENVDPYEELLTNVKACFADDESFLSTVDILDRLDELEEPTQLRNEWVGFKGATMGLSRGLSVHNIKHVRVSRDGDQCWGYTRRGLGLPAVVKLELAEEAAA